jgi:hypothetical protein
MAAQNLRMETKVRLTRRPRANIIVGADLVAARSV